MSVHAEHQHHHHNNPFVTSVQATVHCLTASHGAGLPRCRAGNTAAYCFSSVKGCVIGEVAG
jgi:hypothetical protein